MNPREYRIYRHKSKKLGEQGGQYAYIRINKILINKILTELMFFFLKHLFQTIYIKHINIDL